MKKKLNRYLCIAALLGFTFLLFGCSTVQDEVIITLVKGNLDAMYLNQYEDNYLKLCDITKEEGEKWYAEGIEYEADYFSYYWGISDNDIVKYTDLDKELQEEICNVCDSISKKSKYEVKSVAQQDDESYSVKVVYKPINIMEQANDYYETYEPMIEFINKSNDIDYETISDEEYLSLCNEYGYIIVDMMNELLPNLGYQEEKSMNFQVDLIDELWTTNEDDLATFNDSNIVYP